MTRNLSDLASIAEILGAVAIVVSLIFVGFQINDGNREVRAATTQASLDTEMFLISELLDNAGVWEKVITGAPIAEGEETRTAILLMNMVMTMNENRFEQMNTGYLEPQPLNLNVVVRTDSWDIWRNSGGALNRSREFLEFVDRERDAFLAE